MSGLHWQFLFVKFVLPRLAVSTSTEYFYSTTQPIPLLWADIVKCCSPLMHKFSPFHALLSLPISDVDAVISGHEAYIAS
jgi:hypothetical protein